MTPRAGATGLALLAAAVIAGIVLEVGVHRAPRAEHAQTASCTEADADDFDCRRRSYEALVHTAGVEAAFRQLRADYDGDDLVRLTCHQLTHAIAHAAAHASRHSLPQGEGDHFCGSGYYAGRVEAFVASAGARAALARPDIVCTQVRRHEAHSNHHHNCAHALGHGLMTAARGNLFQALEGCDRLTDAWERGRCHGGVFMDNNARSLTGRRASSRLNRSHPLQLCADLARRYGAACYRQQSSFAVYVRGGDFTTVFGLCATVVELSSRRTCYQGIGFQAAGRSIADRITDVGSTTAAAMLCELGADEEARSGCAVGAVRGFVDNDRDERASKLLCRSVETSLQAVCRRAGRDYYATLRT